MAEDARIAWYREQAEEFGALTAERLVPRGRFWRFINASETCLCARRAAHFAGLVLDLECLSERRTDLEAWQGPWR